MAAAKFGPMGLRDGNAGIAANGAQIAELNTSAAPTFAPTNNGRGDGTANPMNDPRKRGVLTGGARSRKLRGAAQPSRSVPRAN